MAHSANYHLNFKGMRNPSGSKTFCNKAFGTWKLKFSIKYHENVYKIKNVVSLMSSGTYIQQPV